MPALWIQNARVIDPASKRDSLGDLFIANGKIAASLSAADKKRAKKIDAKGLIACPGLVDIHVHFREPGQMHKETIETGSRAAAAGGFTSVVCMPNTAPVADSAGTIQLIKDSITRTSCIRVYPTGCITVGMKGQTLAPIGSLKRAGVVAITDDGDCVQSNELMRRAVEYAKMFDLPIMDHCQDHSMTVGAVMNEGIMSTRLGLKGWPHAAEDIIVSRNVILATYTGAHIHMQHISSKNSVEILRRAKARGVSVTAEATPHHIALTDETLATYDTNFKMNPPLRTEDDRIAIIEGLRDGTLDCLATDHAPHTDYEKDKEFDFAPNGILGLETALAVSLDVLVRQSKFKLPYVIDLFTRKAAKIVNLPAGNLAEGAAADICLFDPEEKWTYDAKAGFSKSSNSPWHGKTLTGRVKTTFVEGRIVFENGKIK
ncbi:dihydroorotase [Nibricoccus aquaticus]|uniref:Dihydroorotase n=1 Tax=Nibricoccus aquaticus TaxID=2576891 RepID=A0A290QBZ6_9BACT|nr:dihydroorotase [Nibricoccus aquaticus]ATC62848.1 dihydroorotase [Nibricoccus aquaticus]